MEKIPKIIDVLRGNCCETYRDIPQKTLMKEFTKKKFLTRKKLFQNMGSSLL